MKGSDLEDTKHVLFICEGNLHRSPTAERLYSTTPGIKARSAGLSHVARLRVHDELLEWANVIVIMEERLREMLQVRFRESVKDKELICLDVPDDFQFLQPELLTILTEKLGPLLGAPFINDDTLSTESD